MGSSSQARIKHRPLGLGTQSLAPGPPCGGGPFGGACGEMDTVVFWWNWGKGEWEM